MTVAVEARAQVEQLVRAGQLSVEDLLAAALGASRVPSPVVTLGTRVPTMVEMLTAVEKATRSAHRDDERGGGTLRTYSSYWRMLCEGYPYQRKGVATRSGSRVGCDPVPADELLYAGCGDRLVTAVTENDVREFVDWAIVRARLDAHWRTLRREDIGRAVRPFDQKGAERNAISAARAFFDVVAGDRFIARAANPALGLAKPPKARGNRRAFTEPEYRELWAEIVGGGNDPQLDALLFETVLVTGARRGGLLGLDIRDLDPVRATIVLREKGHKLVEQPATVDLVERLLRFATVRGSTTPSDPVFSFRDSLRTGSPYRITSRRFDYLHSRIQRAIPWADKEGVSLHWGRHHAIVQVERIAGRAVAAAFARHEAESVTDIYTRATMAEVCRAVGVMTGTVHPLADGGW